MVLERIVPDVLAADKALHVQRLLGLRVADVGIEVWDLVSIISRSGSIAATGLDTGAGVAAGAGAGAAGAGADDARRAGARAGHGFAEVSAHAPLLLLPL